MLSVNSKWLKISLSSVLFVFVGVIYYSQYTQIKSLQNRLKERRFVYIDRSIDCAYADIKYMSAFLRGRRIQLEIDKERFTKECISLVKSRTCPPIYKEKIIMTDGSDVVDKKVKKVSKKTGKKKRGRRKKAAVKTSEDSALQDTPVDSGIEIDVPSAEDVQGQVTVAEPEVIHPDKPQVKSLDLVPEDERAYPVGARFWFTRHAHVDGVLIPPGTVYEVVESVPDDAIVLGGGEYAPVSLRLVRGSGPKYFKLIGRHTALEKM